MISGAKFTVYSLTNSKTGRKYYGRTKNPVERNRAHMTEMRKNAHFNAEMQRDHGDDVTWEFNVIVTGLTQQKANELSDTLAKEDSTAYNLLGVVPSNGNPSKRVLSQEQVEQIRDLYFSGKKKQVELAPMFNVTQGLISLVCNGLIHNSIHDEFVPPRMPIQEKYKDGEVHKEYIRNKCNELCNTMSSFQIATIIKNELGISHACAKHWMKNNPDTKLMRNMFHSASAYTVIIDGKPYRNISVYCKETGKRLKEVMRFHNKSGYYTMENRVLTVDGVEYKIGRTMPSVFLRNNKLLPAVMIHPLEWVTEPTEVTKKNRAMCKEFREIEKAKKALADPVYSKNKRVFIESTATKYKCQRTYLRQLLAKSQSE